jgi:hypothetical protein
MAALRFTQVILECQSLICLIERNESRTLGQTGGTDPDFTRCEGR